MTCTKIKSQKFSKTSPKQRQIILPKLRQIS